VQRALGRRADLRELGHVALKWYVRHFPISKGKARLVARLWEPLTSGRTQRLTVLRQADVRMHCDLTKFLQRRLYFWGDYEGEACHHWIEFSRESKVVFDIGANVGLYSLLAASANPQSNVYAFEPTPEMVTALTRNIQLNGLCNIAVEPVAVGRSEQVGFLRLCLGSDGTNEGMNFISSTRAADSDLPVEVTSLDEYCGRRRIERIDLMKMDIEGGEYDALLGAHRLLQQQAIGCLFIELIEWAANRSGHSIDEIKGLLLDAGYHLYRLRSRALIPVAAETLLDGENVIAFVREPEHLLGRQKLRIGNSVGRIRDSG